MIGAIYSGLNNEGKFGVNGGSELRGRQDGVTGD